MPGVVKLESYEASLLNSLIPQLIDTTVTPGVVFAVCTAVIKFREDLRIGNCRVRPRPRRCWRRGRSRGPTRRQATLPRPSRIGLRAGLVDHVERGAGQIVLGVKRVQRGLNVGIAVHFDQGDRLTRTVTRDRRSRG